MPPKRSTRVANASEAPDAPKRPQRAAKVGKSNPGAYSAASKYVEDVRLLDYSGKPDTMDPKLTHSLSDDCCKKEAGY